MSVTDVLAAVGRVARRPVRRVHCPPVSEPKTLIGDSTRIRADLGWSSPASSIDRIVADVWRWGRGPTPAGAAALPPRQRIAPSIT
ncbi:MULTISPECIES: hypothetical protein [unclassified Frankia]